MQRRLVIAGLAASLAAPAFVVSPADAVIAFTCDSVAGSAVISPGLVHDKRSQSLSSGPIAPVGPQDIVLASTSDTGVKGNNGSFFELLSSDGTTVAFQSRATNLDPADTDTTEDVYVKALTTGDINLASTSDTGVKGNGRSLTGNSSFGTRTASLSSDGTTVAFESLATNLDPADVDTLGDIYVKNLTTGNITLASTSNAGVKSNASSGDPSLSADGTRVAFYSSATNLDPSGIGGLYVKDLTTGGIIRASGGLYPSLSADGTKLAFRSNNLVPADTDTYDDIYVKDLTTGNITLASTSDTGVKGNHVSSFPSLSADGARVAFQSRAFNLDPGDTEDRRDIYVKDLTTGNITLASISDTGTNGDGDSELPSLSGDGSAVAFSTPTSLDPGDTDTTHDTYVKDLTTGNIMVASTSDTGAEGLAGTGELSGDGGRVTFASMSTNLDPADTDTSADVYLKTLPSVPTSVDIAGCSNGNSGTASIVDIRSYGPRPLGCPVALGGAAGNDYADTTPILVGASVSMTIDWASGPNSYGVAAAKAGPTGTQWRFRLAITAGPGHDTPATNQYLPAAGSGFTKTRLQGKLDWSALDSFNCTTGVDDPLSWVSLANNGSWVAKTS